MWEDAKKWKVYAKSVCLLSETVCVTMLSVWGHVKLHCSDILLCPDLRLEVAGNSKYVFFCNISRVDIYLFNCSRVKEGREEPDKRFLRSGH